MTPGTGEGQTAALAGLAPQSPQSPGEFQGAHSPDSIVTCGIDSAESSGVVLIKAGRIVRRGICVVRSWSDVERAADAIAAFEPALVAVEAPYIRVNADTGLVLARLLGRWLQSLERRGIATITVLASVWQVAILAGVTNRTRRAERKHAAIAFAKERFGLELAEDVADAAGIAAWAAESARQPTGAPDRGSSWQSANISQDGRT